MTGNRAPWRRLRLLLPAVLVLVVAIGALQYLRPIPPIQLVRAAPSTVTIPGRLAPLPWPQFGEAAVAVDGVGLVGSHGGDRAEPIGSIAKVMTAVLVLKDHPLQLGAPGPTVTVTATDVATYQQDLAGGQSVVPVATGEVLTELQLLEAMLIPSGNNVATLLAQWDAGSESAFVSKMNAEAHALGLTQTTYADASGLSPATVSDAADQTRLAEYALANPVFAQIVAMPQVTLPVAGVTYNVNADVTHGGIVGVKTGSTPQAGGCFVFAYQTTVGSRSVLVVGAVLGQGGTSVLDDALAAGVQLAHALGPQIQLFPLLSPATVVARLEPAWSTPIAVTPSQAYTALGWPGLRLHLQVASLRLSTALRASQKVGTVMVESPAGRVSLPLEAPTPVRGPSLRWRLTRI